MSDAGLDCRGKPELFERLGVGPRDPDSLHSKFKEDWTLEGSGLKSSGPRREGPKTSKPRRSKAIEECVRPEGAMEGPRLEVVGSEPS